MILRPADRIERTAWIIGGALLAATLPLRSAPVSAGVALGVLVAVLNYRALVRFANGLLASGATALPRARFALYFLKYAVIAAVLYAALKFRIANAIAVLAGASVLLPAILREAVAAREPAGKEA
jgi:hypothetical protein